MRELTKGDKIISRLLMQMRYNDGLSYSKLGKEYLGDISTITLLSREEEIKYSKKVIDSKENMLIIGSMIPGLVHSVFIDYCNKLMENYNVVQNIISDRKYNFEDEAKRADKYTDEELKEFYDNFVSACKVIDYSAKRMKHEIKNKVSDIEYLAGTSRDREQISSIVIRLSNRKPLSLGGDIKKKMESRLENIVSMLEKKNGFNGSAGNLENDTLLPYIEIKRLCNVYNEEQADYISARDALVKGNLRLVIAIARVYSGRMECADLLQAGNIGLIKAAERFDYRRGNKFETYAVWLIRTEVLKELNEKGREIKLPEATYRLLEQINIASDALYQELEREAIPVELSEKTGISPELIEAALIADRGMDSIDDVVASNREKASNRNRHLGEYLEDKSQQSPLDIISHKELHLFLNKVIDDSLTKREGLVLKKHSGIDDREYDWDYTLEEIGTLFLGGVSRERVRQIEALANKRLSKSPELINYLNEINRY